jgi:hypothetical protein
MELEEINIIKTCDNQWVHWIDIVVLQEKVQFENLALTPELEQHQIVVGIGCPENLITK